MNSKLNHKSFRGERQGSSQVGKRNTTTMNFGTQAKKKENVVKPEGGGGWSEEEFLEMLMN